MNVDLWERIAIDWTVISDGLFERAKAECRVDFARDDELIRSKVQAAADMIERAANITLAKATYEAEYGDVLLPCRWWSAFHAYGVLLPFNNVREVRLFDGSDVDVTGDWRVRQREFGSNRDAYLVSRTQTQLPGVARIEMDVGVEDVAEISPFVAQVLLRIASALYEYRESDQPLTDTAFVASRFQNELAAIWRACV